MIKADKASGPHTGKIKEKNLATHTRLAHLLDGRHDLLIGAEGSKIRESTRKIATKRVLWRLKNDPAFRALCNCRTRLKAALKAQGVPKKAIKMIGCTVAELKKHLEGLFQYGMDWTNYGLGGWVIDHIRPVSSFDFALESEQMAAFHWSNLQPLWWTDNMAKADKWEKPVEILPEPALNLKTAQITESKRKSVEVRKAFWQAKYDQQQKHRTIVGVAEAAPASGASR